MNPRYSTSTGEAPPLFISPLHLGSAQGSNSGLALQTVSALQTQAFFLSEVSPGLDCWSMGVKMEKQALPARDLKPQSPIGFLLIIKLICFPNGRSEPSRPDKAEAQVASALGQSAPVIEGFSSQNGKICIKNARLTKSSLFLTPTCLPRPIP